MAELQFTTDCQLMVMQCCCYIKGGRRRAVRRAKLYIDCSNKIYQLHLLNA